MQLSSTSCHGVSLALRWFPAVTQCSMLLYQRPQQVCLVRCRDATHQAALNSLASGKATGIASFVAAHDGRCAAQSGRRRTRALARQQHPHNSP